MAIAENEQFGSRRLGSVDEEESRQVQRQRKESAVKTFGRLTLRGKVDDLPQDWWFASTAIPLLAATIGPLANVLSIAALVTKWKVKLPNNGQLPDGVDNNGSPIPDPTWQIVLNAISLGFGFFGNFFLLLNFTRRIRYIVALPVTIVSWYIATGFLIGIIVSMDRYLPPVQPGETYSQGYWHAIIAAILYMIGSMILMVNMLGYFLGHYPQHFDLDEDQRTLILQTMMFFFWLAGGAAVFSALSDGLSYANALYFCDVTVLTVGFGDIVAINDAGRGLVMPYAVFGIIFLGLMINSIRKFAGGMSRDNVIRKHALHERERTFERTVTSEEELRDRLGLPVQSVKRPAQVERRNTLDEVGTFATQGRTLVFRHDRVSKPLQDEPNSREAQNQELQKTRSHVSYVQEKKSPKGKMSKLARRREKLLVLREERDRFNAMRDIQEHTARFKRYYALGMSLIAFAVLWCVGAAVFMVAERRIQGLTYFQSLYFCYVSLLTIGYGDYAPKSNAGKAFFVIWSLIAIPTMTILISAMGDTVVGAVNRGTFTLADWTVMPKRGLWRDVLLTFPRFQRWVLRKGVERKEKKSVAHGFQVQPPDDENAAQAPNDEDALGRQADMDDARLHHLVVLERKSDHELAAELSKAIKRVTADLKTTKHKKYDYEEWVVFQRLFRFSSHSQHTRHDSEDDEEDTVVEQIDQLEWDWIGEDSPLFSGLSESEWVLDRLCESLDRYTRRQIREDTLSQKVHSHRFQLTAPTFSVSDEKKVHHRTNNGHPDPLRAHSPTDRSGNITPVLSRGPSGVEIVKLGSNSREKHRSRPDSIASENERAQLAGFFRSENKMIDNDEKNPEEGEPYSQEEIVIAAAESAKRRRIVLRRDTLSSIRTGGSVAGVVDDQRQHIREEEEDERREGTEIDSART